MSLIQGALDSPGPQDYFSYPHQGQKVRKNVLDAFEHLKHFIDIFRTVYPFIFTYHDSKL